MRISPAGIPAKTIHRKRLGRLKYSRSGLCRQTKGYRRVPRVTSAGQYEGRNRSDRNGCPQVGHPGKHESIKPILLHADYPARGRCGMRQALQQHRQLRRRQGPCRLSGRPNGPAPKTLGTGRLPGCPTSNFWRNTNDGRKTAAKPSAIARVLKPRRMSSRPPPARPVVAWLRGSRRRPFNKRAHIRQNRPRL